MKKLVIIPLSVLLVFLVNECHGAAPSSSPLSEIEEIHQKLENEIKSLLKLKMVEFKNKRVLNVSEILNVIIDKVKASKLELSHKTEKHKEEVHKAIDLIHENMPQRVIVHTNCDPACVKVECYALKDLFARRKSDDDEERKYYCAKNCHKKCSDFLRDAMECYKTELEGECGLHQHHDVNIRVACHVSISKCLMKKVAKDHLEKEENSLVVGTNDAEGNDERV